MKRNEIKAWVSAAAHRAALLCSLVIALCSCRFGPPSYHSTPTAVESGSVSGPPLMPQVQSAGQIVEASGQAIVAPSPVLIKPLTWDYPPNELEGITFVIHASPDANAPLPWPVLGDTTNLTAQIEMSAQQQFFYVTASNYWTSLESVPGNFVGVPVPPRLVRTTLQ